MRVLAIDCSTEWLAVAVGDATGFIERREQLLRTAEHIFHDIGRAAERIADDVERCFGKGHAAKPSNYGRHAHGLHLYFLGFLECFPDIDHSLQHSLYFWRSKGHELCHVHVFGNVGKGLEHVHWLEHAENAG